MKFSDLDFNALGKQFEYVRVIIFQKSYRIDFVNTRYGKIILPLLLLPLFTLLAVLGGAYFVFFVYVIHLTSEYSAFRSKKMVNFAKENLFSYVSRSSNLQLVENSIYYRSRSERMSLSEVVSVNFSDIGEVSVFKLVVNTVNLKGQKRKIYIPIVNVKMPYRYTHNVFLWNKKGKLSAPKADRRLLSKDNELSIDSYFDEFYTVYSPKGYEIETYKVFGPEVMQDILKAKSKFHIEINRNDIYVYLRDDDPFKSPGPFVQAMHISKVISKSILQSTRHTNLEDIEDKVKNIPPDLPIHKQRAANYLNEFDELMDKTHGILSPLRLKKLKKLRKP